MDLLCPQRVELSSSSRRLKTGRWRNLGSAKPFSAVTSNPETKHTRLPNVPYCGTHRTIEAN